MRVLSGASIWVDYLRRGRTGEAWAMDALLEQGAITICGPVVAELLAGTPRTERDAFSALLEGISWTPLGREEWRRTGAVAAELRERGMTVPLTNLEIAVSAVAGEADLWSIDRDFDRIAAALPELRRFRPSWKWSPGANEKRTLGEC